MMLKFIILFIAILTLFLFCNYKFRQAGRIIAYNEEEQPQEAIYAMICMLVSVISWSLYLALF
jgi:uncharacterized membrane protein YiaA